MKYWTIAFPGECGQHVQETWSEEQILKSAWYRNWVYKMVQASKEWNDQLAIEDWCTIHWAVETDEWGNKCQTTHNNA